MSLQSNRGEDSHCWQILSTLNSTPTMTSEDRFQAAVNIIKCLPKDGPFQPSHDMMLKFYGLYKQAIEGPCNEPKPAFYELVKGYKWRAWHSLGSMSRTEAMDAYVDELKKIIETMSYTENVANFIDALGPFYEYIDIPGLKPKNNNTKGLDDSPVLNAVKSEDENLLANGHAAKMNGNACSDLDPVSDEVQSSSEESSPEFMSIKSNGIAVPLTLDKDIKEAVEEEDEELVVMEVHNTAENTTTHMLALSPKLYSDSDSDEEYSDPAEIVLDYPMLESKTTNQQSVEAIATDLPSFVREGTPGTPNSGIEVPNDPVACGGGDQSHPGGLQMTPRQTQGSAFSNVQFGASGDSMSLGTPSHLGGLVRSSGSGGGFNGGGGRKGGSETITEDVNAQLVALLRRLQNDMENVLHRLNSLETLTVNQHHTLCHHCQVSSSNAATMRTERSWWPFPELSPRSTFFLLIWPLLLHGGIKLLLLLRSRRRRQ